MEISNIFSVGITKISNNNNQEKNSAAANFSTFSLNDVQNLVQYDFTKMARNQIMIIGKGY